MPSYVFVDAFTGVERHAAIQRLKEAIAGAGGVIADFAFFSNEAMRMTVELEGDHVPRLRAAFAAADIRLFDRGEATLDAAERSLGAANPVVVLVHCSFVHDEADLANETPHA